MDLNIPVAPNPKKTNYGFTALIGGIITFLFGGGSLFAIISIPVTIISTYNCFKKESYSSKSKNMAKIGLGIMIVAVILAFVFHWHGLVFELISKYFI